MIDRLASVYGNSMEDVDIWAGGLLETSDRPGQLFNAIIRDQFTPDPQRRPVLVPEPPQRVSSVERRPIAGVYNIPTTEECSPSGDWKVE